MKQPDGWPFDSWIDLDVLANSKEPILEAIAELQNDYLEFARSFLQGGGESLRLPRYFSNVLYGLTAPTCLGAATRLVYGRRPGYAIGIDSSSWLQLLLCASRLLSDSSALLCLHLLTPKGPRELYGGAAEWPQLGGSSLSQLREVVAYATRFLFLHEVSHIDLCHLDYLLILRQQRGQIGDFEFQCLEHQADLKAIFWATFFVNCAGLVKAAQQNPRYKAKLIGDELWKQGFAIGIVALLLETLNEYTDSHHPPAARRAALLRLAPAASPAAPIGIDKENAIELLDKGFEGAIAAWDRRGWPRCKLGVDLQSLGIFLDGVARTDKAVTASGAHEFARTERRRRDND